MLGQYPFVVGPTGLLLQDPNSVVSNAWPQHMEPQPLYPVATSTYTWPTGTSTVKVPCFAQGKVVAIERAECPDSFVNPIDPNHVSSCVKVNGRTVVLGGRCCLEKMCCLVLVVSYLMIWFVLSFLVFLCLVFLCLVFL
jgi:hypothetical protein